MITSPSKTGALRPRGRRALRPRGRRRGRLLSASAEASDAPLPRARLVRRRLLPPLRSNLQWAAALGDRLSGPRLRTRSRADQARARRLAQTEMFINWRWPPTWGSAARHPPAHPLAAASCASSQSADAASWWRAHAAVPQHSGPIPGGGRSPGARPCYQLQGAPGSPPLP